ncbi:MAG: DnaD domain protein [Syntrophomonadaceae bacterium]|jgi:DnaD/phage-associated family protein|nr:DnaD domain protein [Syntrophomonadaceae bacterium]
MALRDALLEVLRLGLVQMPAALYQFAAELQLDAEDLGLLGAVFCAYARSQALTRKGVEVRDILECYPALSRRRLTNRLARWEAQGLVAVERAGTPDAQAQAVSVEPLLRRLEGLLCQGRPHVQAAPSPEQLEELRKELEESRARISELEKALEQARQVRTFPLARTNGKANGFKLVADFIAQKTGNLVSPEFQREITRWLEDYRCQPEFLVAMLELCFERNIFDARGIAEVARGLHQYQARTLEAMEYYFRHVVDQQGPRARRYEYSLEAMQFGNYTGISMQAQARRDIYEKWRVEWGFSAEMILKAGEIMCRQTKEGGLEYVEQVLANWRSQGITTVEEAERVSREYKQRTRRSPDQRSATRQPPREEVEIFVAPHVIETLKSKP